MHFRFLGLLCCRNIPNKLSRFAIYSGSRGFVMKYLQRRCVNADCRFYFSSTGNVTRLFYIVLRNQKNLCLQACTHTVIPLSSTTTTNNYNFKIRKPGGYFRLHSSYSDSSKRGISSAEGRHHLLR